MKRDILTRNDIEKVIQTFYEKVKLDKDLNIFFTDIIQVNWEHHNAIMCDFWENVLFYTGNYEGNPLNTHKRVNAIHKTEAEHFQKWQALFFQSVDELFEGANTEKMKQHAIAIANVMQQKI